MTDRPVIALDCMGGDGGPATTVAAAELAAAKCPKIGFRLYGREDAIRAALAKAPRVAQTAVIVHTDEEVLGTDKPSQVLRRARKSSIGLAVEAVKAGEAHAAVSAGNTGALMAIAKLSLRTMEGIDRPALAAILPTMKGEVVMLDLGANTECDENNLVQFAVMGAAFARTALGLERPRVALLNIGEEDLKGTHELKAASAMLRDSAADLPLEFAGFTEGDKIGQGDVDVVVSDGFSGNIALKTIEGTARLITGMLRNAITSSLRTQFGYIIAKPAFAALRRRIDPNNHNGAVFLGLNGVVVKSHGSATPQGFANAIVVAHNLVTADISARIRADLKNFEAHRRPVASRLPDADAA